MGDRGYGILGGDCTVLFFILVFLCLFTTFGGCGSKYGYKE